MAAFDIGNILGNPIFLGSLGLTIIGWVIALAGAAATNASIKFTWFVIFYDLFLIIGVLFAVATDSVRYYRLVIMTALGISITLVCEQINGSIYINLSEFQALGAGFIFIAITQFVWLFLFGTEEGSIPHRIQNSVSINKNLEVHPNAAHTTRVDSNLPMRSVATDHHMSQVIVSPNAEYAYKAKALYDYQQNPEDPNELSFAKGEVLDIVDNKGKWWQARKADGTVGIAPSNYLQII